MVKKNTYKGFKFVFDAFRTGIITEPIYGYSEFYLNHECKKGVNRDGYLLVAEYRLKGDLEHVIRAENAYGGKLPTKALVHHHNADQLVICEDQKYHTFIHKRMRNCGYDKKFWTKRIKKLRLGSYVYNN